MNPISIDRIKLLSIMRHSLKDVSIYRDYKGQLESIVSSIKEDKQYYLSIAQNKPNCVEYSTSKEKFKNRQPTTLARYIRRQLNCDYYKLPDCHLESFCNLVTSKIISEKMKHCIESGLVKILTGEDIRNYYATTAAKHSPSCMTGPANSKKIEMFAVNPDKISLVVFDEIGRGLLWTSDDGRKCLDYAYPFQSQTATLVMSYAEYKNYYIRERRMPGADFKITVKTTEQYPRLDTFCYANLDLSNKTAVLQCSSDNTINCIMTNIDGKMRMIK